MPILSRQGRLIPTLHHIFLLRDGQGRPYRRALVVTDITEQKRAEEALRRGHRSLEHMLRASDYERQLIAYDIHDGLAQELVGAIMQFQAYDQFKETRPDEARKAYDGGMTLLRKGHVEARRLISGVRPPILDESGVVAAIAHLVYDPAFEGGPKIDLHSKVAFHRLNPGCRECHLPHRPGGPDERPQPQQEQGVAVSLGSEAAPADRDSGPGRWV